MNELQTLLHETITRIFSDLITQPLLEGAEAGEWPTVLWDAIEECGLTRPHLSEEYGGAEGTWVDAHVIAYAAGAHTVPVPLVETILASWLLAQAGIDIPDGPLTIVPEVVDDSALEDNRLSCEAMRVPWGRSVSHAVLTIAGGETARVGLVSLDGAAIAPEENLAREPRDRVTFTNTPLTALQQTALPADIIYRYGAMMRTAQMSGALSTILAQSVQYVGERQQFGRPIGKFQAIQQELARLAGQVALADTAAKAAFRAADQAQAHGVDPACEIAAAKIILGDAVELSTNIAHQVHGAIGFTYEHALHFATRRLWSWRAEFGTAEAWAALLGREALAQGADGLWPFVTAR